MTTKTKAVIHECDNCDWEGPEEKLACAMADMADFFERITPGCPVPSGDCPECGACCYPRDENWRKLKAFDGLLAACEQVLADIGDRLTGRTTTMLRAAIAKAKGQ